MLLDSQARSCRFDGQPVRVLLRFGLAMQQTAAPVVHQVGPAAHSGGIAVVGKRCGFGGHTAIEAGDLLSDSRSGGLGLGGLLLR